MLTGPFIILALKVAVSAVTVLLLASLAALAAGRPRVHGWINRAFFVLTMTAVVGLELIIRLDPAIHAYFWEHDAIRRALRIHLCFSVPAALVLPVMLYTGLGRRKRIHVGLGVVFGVLWAGTFVTGLFFLPHGPQE